MSTRYFVITLVFVGSCLLSGCGSSTPSEVMKTAIMKANEGKYAESNQAFSDYMKKAFVDDTLKQNYWDTVTKKKTIASIEIVGEESMRTSASVEVKLVYKDGTSLQAVEMLIKENGEWRISSNNLTATEKPKDKKRIIGGSK